MLTSSLLNVATHPESHNFPIDKSDPVLSYGKRCVWHEASGRPVIGMMPVFVDVMRLPLESCTWKGLVSGWMLLYMLLVLEKWPLYPVSDIVC